MNADTPSRTAVIMARGSIHGRMLLEAMVAAGLPPAIVVAEDGTARAQRVGRFLANDIDNPPDMATILGGAPTRVFVTDDFQGQAALAALDEAAPDYVVNGGAGLYKEPILARPRRLFLNAHPGLLPAFRGLDPIPWALLENAPVGATLHAVTPGLDDGDMLIRREADTAGAASVLALRLRVLRLCAALVVDYLTNPRRWPPVAQDHSAARNRGAFPEHRMPEAEAALTARNAVLPDTKRPIAQENFR
jgi:methionyl-tRNA formyltransferase